MNGTCAGGTGAFIDQMAVLLNTDAGGLNEAAKSVNMIYPIAARCGVFAKTDIQPLINEGAKMEDLAASIFQAVVNQTIGGLACGRKIKGNALIVSNHKSGAIRIREYDQTSCLCYTTQQRKLLFILKYSKSRGFQNGRINDL